MIFPVETQDFTLTHLLVERAGRRKLMLFGAFGMMASMAILAGSTSTGETLENGAPQLSTTYGGEMRLFTHVQTFAEQGLSCGNCLPLRFQYVLCHRMARREFKVSLERTSG